MNQYLNFTHFDSIIYWKKTIKKLEKMLKTALTRPIQSEKKTGKKVQHFFNPRHQICPQKQNKVF